MTARAVAPSPARLDELRDLRDRLAAATLASERLRIAILVATWTLALVLLAITAWWLPMPGEVRAQISMARIALHIGAFIGYELLAFAVVVRRVSRRRAVPAPWWYANAVVEVSLITAVLASTRFSFHSPLFMLSAPAFGFYFALIILSILRLDRNQSIFTGVVAALQYLGVVVWVLTVAPPGAPDEPLLWSPFYYVLAAGSLVVAGLGAGFVAAEVGRRTRRVLDEERRRARVVGVFGQFVSPALVAELVDSEAELASERRRVCIMFLDIREFSTFAEDRDPAEVVAYIDTVFRFMSEIVQRHQGMIHQYQGDGFLAFFGAPRSRGNDCQNAVAAALALVARVAAEVEDGRIPPTRIGIGLHVGDVVTGTIGSSVHREYAVTGDAVNLASRIEGLNKRYGSAILASAQVVDQIAAGGADVADLGSVDIRGRSGSVHLYRLA